MASLNEALNIKTQENILKQEAIDEKVKTLQEFSETCNNQNNQLNQLKEETMSLRQENGEVKKENLRYQQEKDTAV